jgi:hypothetical protein
MPHAFTHRPNEKTDWEKNHAPDRFCFTHYRNGARLTGPATPGAAVARGDAFLGSLPTFVNIAGGSKDGGLKKRDRGRPIPAIVKMTLDGVDPA